LAIDIGVDIATKTRIGLQTAGSPAASSRHFRNEALLGIDAKKVQIVTADVCNIQRSRRHARVS
jgi:hypothetical protein